MSAEGHGGKDDRGRRRTMSEEYPVNERHIPFCSSDTVLLTSHKSVFKEAEFEGKEREQGFKRM